MTKLFDTLKHGLFRFIALLIWIVLFALMGFEIVAMLIFNGLHYVKSRLPIRRKPRAVPKPEEPYMRWVTRNRTN